MKLRSTRRGFLTAATGLATATLFSPWDPAAALQRTNRALPPPSNPNEPNNPNVPGGMDTHPTSGPSRTPTSSVNAAQLVTMVEQLYQLSAELKQETDRTNMKDTLPADFIKRAQQIEKLAKNIREKAKG